jgi:hypothetical protein
MGETRVKIEDKDIMQRKFLEHQYLSFGKETSDVSYKLYNKTKELTTMKMKNWIYYHWQENGYLGNQDVWRLEFSLKNDQKKHIITNEGDLIEFSIFEDLNSILNNRVKMIYDYYLKTCFSFYRNNGKSRKDRNETLKIFDNEQPEFVRINISETKETGRKHKIFAKMLMQVNQEMRGDDYVLGLYGHDFFNNFVERYSLQNWCKEKGFDYEKFLHMDWKIYTDGLKKKKELLNIETMLNFLNEN